MKVTAWMVSGAVALAAGIGGAVLLLVDDDDEGDGLERYTRAETRRHREAKRVEPAALAMPDEPPPEVAIEEPPLEEPPPPEDVDGEEEGAATGHALPSEP